MFKSCIQAFINHIQKINFYFPIYKMQITFNYYKHFVHFINQFSPYYSLPLVTIIFIYQTMQKQEQNDWVQLGNYRFQQKYCIGQGSFGKVYKGVNLLTSRQVAIKQMDGKEITLQEITSEITILKQLRHDNIVEYEDAFSNNGFFYIVTEYCKGGDLRNTFQDSDQQDGGVNQEQNLKQKQNKIVEMLKQVCAGFEYLREHNIIHRDLKPSNIMIHEGKFKIGDFGLARRQSVHKSVVNQQLIGVPIYMAPQILSKNYYTYKCDVWSLGIIIYEMLFDQLPWNSQDAQSLFFNIMKNPYPYVGGKRKIPKIVLFLLKNTLQYLERDRLSWTDLLKAICNINSLGQVTIPLPQTIHKMFTLPHHLHKSIPLHQVQIINHLFSQAKAIQPQLRKLSSEDSYKILLTNIIKYLKLGQEKMKLMLNDTVFMFLKTCGENLHIFMIELDVLEDGRLVLGFLELLHDFVFASQEITPEGFKRKIGLTNRNAKIDQYAAQVISKVNTFSISREFQAANWKC